MPQLGFAHHLSNGASPGLSLAPQSNSSPEPHAPRMAISIYMAIIVTVLDPRGIYEPAHDLRRRGHPRGVRFPARVLHDHDRRAGLLEEDWRIARVTRGDGRGGVRATARTHLGASCPCRPIPCGSFPTSFSPTCWWIGLAVRGGQAQARNPRRDQRDLEKTEPKTLFTFGTHRRSARGRARDRRGTLSSSVSSVMPRSPIFGVTTNRLCGW